jgi:hypothetical protein
MQRSNHNIAGLDPFWDPDPTNLLFESNVDVAFLLVNWGSNPFPRVIFSYSI